MAQMVWMGFQVARSPAVVGPRRSRLLAACRFLAVCLALAALAALCGVPSPYPRVAVLDSLIVMVGTAILAYWVRVLLKPFFRGRARQ